MIKKITQNKPLFLLWGAFIIYAAVNSICIIPAGDDYWWYANSTFDEIIGSHTENGRYFTNILTYYIVRIPVLRIAIMTVFTAALAAVIYKIVNNYGNKFAASAISVFVIITIPNEIISQTVNWISGFTNYVIGAVLSLAYLYICLPLFNGKYSPIKKRWAVLTAMLGFLGSLCVENVTIINGLFAAFVIVFSFLKYKKVNFVHIAYFIATAAASALMAFSSAYSSIISDENDNFGFRFVDFGGPEMMIKVFNEILPYFARRSCILHILIAISVLIIYNKKYRDTEAKKRPKYAKLFLPIIILYSAYSLYSCYVGTLASLNTAYRIFAFETAFTFLYLVGLVYMFFCISSASDFIRRVIFVLGAVIATAPFVAVNPVTSRCFFMTYVFWALIAADAAISAVYCADLKEKSIIETSVSLFVAFFCITMAGTSACNKYVHSLRINYIKEQMDRNSKMIQIIELPYTKSYVDYFIDIFGDSENYNDEMVYDEETGLKYKQAICEYYDLDESFLNKSYLFISTTDYYT